MRTILIAALLASVTSPALAAQDRGGWRSGNSDRSDNRAERGERRDNRAQRPQRQESRSERPERQESPPAVAERPDRPQSQPAPVERRAEPRRGGFVAPPAEAQAPAASEASGRTDSVRDWRSGERQRADRPAINLRRDRSPTQDGGDLVEQRRPLPPVMERGERRRISRTPVFGAEPPAPATATLRHARPDRRWSGDWRHDRRYDWRDYRRRHASRFRIGFYFDPFGWGYHRYGIGWRLWPSYYSSRYWLNDPWMYRLPPAYGPYRWVRYWDDALLVNIYTGEVVDVIHNFFW